MKRITYVLLVLLVFSFLFLFSEYSKYQDKNKKLIILEKELLETSVNLKDSSDDISRLKADKDNINKEKEIQIKLYEKWQRQSRVLEDLLK